jgi:Uma2 family endonuclease
MTLIKSQLTLQEFLDLPPDEGDITYELIDGKAVPKMSPKKFHSRLTRTLLNLLDLWGQQSGGVYPNWSIALRRRNQDWVPAPDLLYVSYERLPLSWVEDTACPVAPNLVIEIISPGQTFRQQAGKARDYLDAGVLRVWVVDSQARSITVFYPDAPPKTYMGDEAIADSLFEGLEINPEQVFQQAGTFVG